MTPTPTMTPTPQPNATMTPTPTMTSTPIPTPTPTATAIAIIDNWAYTTYSQTLIDPSIGDTPSFSLEKGFPVIDFDGDFDLTDEIYILICPVGTTITDISWIQESFRSNVNSVMTGYEYGENGIGYAKAECNSMREVEVSIVTVANGNSANNPNQAPIVTIIFPDQDTDGGFLQRLFNRPGQVRALDTIWFVYNSIKDESRGYY